MAEWLVEEGIGEQRALMIDHGEAVAAKLHWPGDLVAGRIIAAKLTSKPSGAQRGTARTDRGAEILVDHLPMHLTEGQAVTLRVSRAAINERGRLKRAQGRFVDGDGFSGEHASDWLPDGRVVRRFPIGLWEDVWSAAASGTVEFAGGVILVSATPAMTLIDIDGDGSPRELALAAIPAIAKALSWFDLGGSIGIDFPTIEARAERKCVDAALAKALVDWPHERTAINGFGFVQLVARLEGPSLLHRFATSRAGLCARMALRRAEMVEGAGALLMTVHPAIKAMLKPEWLEELARRTGKEVRIASDPGLALEAAQAQIIA